MKTILLSFLLLTFCPLYAFEFRVLSWEGDIAGLKFKSGSEVVEIAARDGSLSPAYSLPSETPLRVYRESTANGTAIRIPVSIPAPPSGITRGILVLAAGPDANAFGGSWIDDSVEQSPPGTARFYNYTNIPLALKILGDQWMQSPGEFRRVAFDTSRRSMPIQVAAETSGRWARVANVSQPVRPTHRLLVFLRDARASAGGPKELVELRVFYDL